MVSVSFRGGLPLLIFRIALFIKNCKENAMNFETFYKKRSSRRCLGGRGVAQVRTCAVGFPPDSGREPGFLRRKPEERAPGAVPPGPPASWPARYSLARFGVVGRSEMVDRLLRTPCTYPDLETFFRKMLFQHIFSLENASQIGLRIPDEIAPRLHQRQPRQKLASGNERPSKPGVQGRSPGPLSPHFSGEMGTPAGQAGPPGRCAPKLGTAPATQRVRSTVLPPAGGPGGGRRRLAPAAWVSRPVLGGDPGFL